MSASPFRAGGALTDEHAAIYIERQVDRDALTHLRAMDYLLVIEPRQQGKTSLINHLMCHPALSDVAFAYVDVTTPDRSTEAAWYRTLCPRILRQLRSFIPRNQWPAIPQNSAGWREFLCDAAMFATDAHRRVVIALDEIGAVTFPGATEFFSVLRDVYNSRQAETEFRQLTFLLSGAFHPRDLIEDDKISPFNIAQRVRLADFTLARVRELVGKGNWSDEQAIALAERIHHWTDGQPYLSQLLCSYLGSDATPADVDASVERLRREDGNHLPPLLKRLNSDEKLRRYVERILVGERIKFYPRENRRQAQLELLGATKEDAEGYCIVRNRIYEQVLAYRFSSPSVPAILLNFTSDHLLVEQDWQYYGSEKERVSLLLKYDSGLNKRVLVKKGHGLDAGARHKPPGAPPLGWKYSHYEFMVRLHPESAICIRVQDATGKEHTLVYSSAILQSESKKLRELYIEIDKDISDGSTWCSLIVNLPAHMKYAQWPDFAVVNWFSLRGEVALAGIRGCDDAETLLASVSASPYVVRPASVSNRLPEPVVGIAPQEAAPMSSSEFTEALQRGSFAFFLGADLPREVTGLPCRADLARKLARRKGLDEALSLAEVAQRVSQAGNRWEFTDFIRNALDTTGKSPQPFHRHIVRLVQDHQVETIITTAYDNLLELAFQEAGIGVNRVVRGSDVGFINPDRPTLIKLYGDAQQPDTLVVTEDDHYGLWRDRDKEDLLDEVRTVLRRQTVLFLGYNLADPDFNLLWREVLDRAGRFARTAYAVWPGLPGADVRMWRDRGIVILEDDPLGILGKTQTPEPVHPTAADLRQFLRKDYHRLEEALNAVSVSTTGRSPLGGYAATNNWKQIASRFTIPEDVDTLFRTIYETRELGRGGVTKLTAEQLQSARQGIEHILKFLHAQFPAAGIKTLSSHQKTMIQVSAIRGDNMDYRCGLAQLKKCLEQQAPDALLEFTTLEERLHKNERAERIFGGSENTRNEHSQIIYALNELALAHCGISFNDLCLGKQPLPQTPPAPDQEVIERLERIEAKLDHGREQDRQTAAQILDAIAQNQVEQAEATQMVAELRTWAQRVQQAGLPLNPELRAALDALAEHTGGVYQYLELALPIIPGILSYKVELGSQHQVDLKAIWERIKNRLGKGFKGNGVDTGAEPLYGTGQHWAVLVGVNEYEDKANYGQLHVCVKDVHAIREQLIAGGFDPVRIRLLTDQTGELPTKANILVALKAMADATEPDDLLLFYYSGHGDEERGGSYLVARDGRRLVLGDTAVPLARVREIVEDAPARARVVVLDACHSGADIGGKGPKPMSEEFIRRVFEQAEGLAVLASCKQGQLSYEWRENERSVFTHFLLEALEGQADHDEKGFITVQDANRHVADGVRLWASQRNLSQTPTLEGKLAGDIILTEYRRRPLRPVPSSSSFTPLSGRITDPDRVFDRGRELAQALDLLRVGSSVALIGPAGIGKSSLLTLLTARVREELGPSWEAVYLDLQRLANEEQFCEALCERLHVPTCRGLALQKALEGRRVLLCLDEVEKLSWDDDGFTRGLRAELRGLAEGPDAPLKLALAARTSLDRLFPDSAGETSPLANICLQVDVGPWDEATARDFLLDRLGGTGVRFTEAESARLVTESGGYPMKLMRAAHRLYGERTGGVR